MDTCENATIKSPFQAFGGKGVELFAQAGVRDVGEVLRFGAPNISGRELAAKALGRGATGEVVEGESFELKPENPERRIAYGEILREALYVHALNVLGKLFDVSRVGRSGVLLTAKLVEGSWAYAPVSDAVAVLDQYTLNIEIFDNFAHVVCSLGHELRSPLTVRQILDDPSLMDLPDGAEVVALGGPHLQGRLSYASSDWTIGEKREELKGESLIEYHRKRYPARVELLAHARASDKAVELTQPGRTPSAYPAELLSPVIRMAILDAQTRDAVANECTRSPADLQERITAIRSMLGQPFAPQFDVEEKMKRFSAPLKFVTFDKEGRRGNLVDGPAVMTSDDVVPPPITLLLGTSTRISDKDGSRYVEHLIEAVEKTMRSWEQATAADISRIKSDVSGAKIVWFDDTSFQTAEAALRAEFRSHSPGSTTFLVSSSGHAFVEAGARRASASINSRVRWAREHRRLCFALVALRGGQATASSRNVAPEYALKSSILFAGAGTKAAGLPIVNNIGEVVCRQIGAPYGSAVTDAVRAAIGLRNGDGDRCEHVIVHHLGESDDEDISAAAALAAASGTRLAVVDVLDNSENSGRVLGWRNDLGVVQPICGFWDYVSGEDDAIIVTTGSRPVRVVRRRHPQISSTQTLDQLVAHIFKLTFLCTDCVVPTKHLSQHRLPITLISRSPHVESSEIILVL